MSKYKVDLNKNKQVLLDLVQKIIETDIKSEDDLFKLFKKYTDDKKQMFSKSKVLVSYKKLQKMGELSLSKEDEQKLRTSLRMKKIRTLSGVTPVTVLTKPFPCPGKCIFCPSDVRMPKSYLSDEPGAQRAEMNKFDPYLQTFNRLTSFRNTGHPTDKTELLVLGGTWTFYPEEYQIWFIKRCFDAMNDFAKMYDSKMLSTDDIEMPFEEKELLEVDGEKMDINYNRAISKALAAKSSLANEQKSTWKELFAAHEKNQTSKTKCVGLSIETRPDEINEEEVLKIRKLGATKVQIGIQSLNDEVLSLNKRGHDVAQTERAINLLRQAGFKIHAHWMPNLYGSTPQEDEKDFDQLFQNISIRPDELKVYPCSLIKSAELMKYYKNGSWNPYSQEELLGVLQHAVKNTPRYCRLTRIIRDIPSTDILVGNKVTNFRQVVEASVDPKDQHDIRSREIKDKSVEFEDLSLKTTTYETDVSTEHFLEYVTKSDEIAGFLRLSIPKIPNFIPELQNTPMIREVHVYGKSIKIGKKGKGAQHLGLGTSLINNAMQMCKDGGFKQIAVISSIGTIKYYEKFNFEQKEFYQIASIA